MAAAARQSQQAVERVAGPPGRAKTSAQSAAAATMRRRRASARAWASSARCGRTARYWIAWTSARISATRREAELTSEPQPVRDSQRLLPVARRWICPRAGRGRWGIMTGPPAGPIRAAFVERPGHVEFPEVQGGAAGPSSCAGSLIAAHGTTCGAWHLPPAAAADCARQARAGHNRSSARYRDIGWASRPTCSQGRVADERGGLPARTSVPVLERHGRRATPRRRGQR